MVEQLRKMEERLDATTPGPWENRGMGIVSAPVPSIYNDEEKGITISSSMTPILNEAGRVATEEDTEFIAHAPTDMRTLIDRVQRVHGFAAANVLEQCLRLNFHAISTLLSDYGYDDPERILDKLVRLSDAVGEYYREKTKNDEQFAKQEKQA